MSRQDAQQLAMQVLLVLSMALSQRRDVPLS